MAKWQSGRRYPSPARRPCDLFAFHPCAASAPRRSEPASRPIRPGGTANRDTRVGSGGQAGLLPAPCHGLRTGLPFQEGSPKPHHGCRTRHPSPVTARCKRARPVRRSLYSTALRAPGKTLCIFFQAIDFIGLEKLRDLETTYPSGASVYGASPSESSRTSSTTSASISATSVAVAPSETISSISSRCGSNTSRNTPGVNTLTGFTATCAAV